MVGVVECDCLIHGCTSLKEKRRVLKSVLTRIRSHYNLSAAEVDYQDYWQRTLIEIAGVANDRRFLESELQSAMQLLERSHELEVCQTSFHYY